MSFILKSYEGKPDSQLLNVQATNQRKPKTKKHATICNFVFNAWHC